MVMVLLFLFPFCTSAFVSTPSDTLIIDGEIVIIEKEEIGVNIDSIAESARNDVKDKPVRKSFLTAGIYTGLNITSAAYRTSSGNVVPLDDFTGNSSSLNANFSYGADLCAKFWSFSTGKIDVAVGAVAGINLNKIKISSAVITDESPFELDSILKLRYVQGELLLDYFEYTDFPFGELDTASIEYERRVTDLTTIDIPLSLRFTALSMNSNWSFFGEAGICLRQIRPGGETFDNFLVNESGSLAVLRKNEFKPVNQLRPLFSLGTECELPKTKEHSHGHFSIGLKLSGSFPKSALNSGSLFIMDFNNYMASLFLRRSF